MLARLLEDERAALFASRHARLADLAARKARLVGELFESEEGLTALVGMQGELRRNLALVGAVRAGLVDLRAGAARPAPALRTYGPDGQTGATVPPGAQILGRF